MLELRYYIEDNHVPFKEWFASLNTEARAKITVALIRLERGNVSHVKSVGAGVLECRVDFGPGYRVYFGRDGGVLVILLTGGIKKRQDRDIEPAKAMWDRFKDRTRGRK